MIEKMCFECFLPNASQGCATSSFALEHVNQTLTQFLKYIFTVCKIKSGSKANKTFRAKYKMQKIN